MFGRYLLLIGFILAPSAVGCQRTADSSTKPAVAVGNSYLESAVHDLLGQSAPVAEMVQPGICPGHVDVRPSQVDVIRSCRLLLLFDFQTTMDRQVSELHQLRTVPIKISNGMCEPTSYLAVCKQTAAALEQTGLLDPGAAGKRLTEIQARLNAETASLRNQLKEAGLVGRAVVVTSGHQTEFCRWLRLDVLASLDGDDAASIRSINDVVIKAQARSCKLVIANRPDGTQLAQMIANHLGGRVAVFDNFPSMTGKQTGFDAMLADNVDRLIAAGAPHRTTAGVLP